MDFANHSCFAQQNIQLLNRIPTDSRNTNYQSNRALQKGDNAWLMSGGKWGWEEVPYWFRGYGDLVYLLKDEAMLKETKTWIEAILKSQKPDGNFGPYTEN